MLHRGVVGVTLGSFVCLQYSAKEDKYEEEIKVLTDKLKEVSLLQYTSIFPTD